MKFIKGLLLLLLLAIVILQAFRPEKNSSPQSPLRSAPADIRTILETSCYDCHSNATRYPWYAEIQPVGWWLADHIREGKREVNFSEFDAYPARRRYRKYQEITEQVTQGEMPLASYLWLHHDAKLTHDQITRIAGWAEAMRDSMRITYPPDSLERRR